MRGAVRFSGQYSWYDGYSQEKQEPGTYRRCFMYKFFDYLLPDLPVKAIGELAGYIRRFTAMQRSDIPVEGHMGDVAFCATQQPSGDVRVHWVQVMSRSGCSPR
mgnify:CR=1 FL=1